MVGTEVALEGAGNEDGTSMERTMYPGSGLSIEITPLILPECMMYEWDYKVLLELYCEGGRRSCRLASASRMWCVCVDLTDPLHGGGPGVL